MPLQTQSGGTDDRRLLTWWTATVLVLVPAFYWACTGQVWEDFLITWRHSANLAAGNGLVYQPGVRVHGFTSPLNALLPALFAAFTGARDFPVPLLLYNVLSLLSLAAGGAILVRTLWPVTPPGARWGLWLFPVLLALCVRVSAHSVNGQEAGFWVLFLAISYAAAARGHARAWLLGGIGWAGLMWTRPDSPVHIAALATGALLFPATTRKGESLGLLRSAGLCAALYLPWFAWAWWYYGSPVPNTILAKMGAYPGVDFHALGAADWARQLGRWLGGQFMPAYAEAGGWPLWLWAGASVMGAAILATSLSSRDRHVRLAGAAFAGSMAYTVLVSVKGMVFPWYSIPPAFFGAVIMARWPALAPGAEHRRPRWEDIAAACAALAVLGCGFAGAVRQVAIHQRIIEGGVRKPAGLWLAANVRPGERVYLEPIGYIGWYSGADILDYPGLVSPAVVEARRKHGLNYLTLIPRLKPEWVVLRCREYRMAVDAGVLAAYAPCARFDASAGISALKDVPGTDFLLIDSCFVILHRRDVSPR